MFTFKRNIIEEQAYLDKSRISQTQFTKPLNLWLLPGAGERQEEVRGELDEIFLIEGTISTAQVQSLY